MIEESSTQIANMIQREIAKYMNSSNSTYMNMVNHLESVGNQPSFALSAYNSFCKNIWIIDTGASNHICGNLTLFDKIYDLKTPCLVILPNGTKLKVTKAGTVFINPSLMLTDVFFISDFCINLFSVHKLTMLHHICCIFHPSYFEMQDLQTKRVVASGNLEGNLYTLRMDQQSASRNNSTGASFTALVNTTYFSNGFSSSVNNIDFKTDELNLWHCRLAHASLNVMKRLSCLHLPKSLVSLNPCTVCHMAKQQRLRFDRSSETALQIFELVHVGVWGPYSQFTLTGSHYFMTFVDDTSMATLIFFIKHKSESP